MATSVRADLARLAALLPSLASRCGPLHLLTLSQSRVVSRPKQPCPRYRATIAWDTATNRDVAFTLSLLGEVAGEGDLQARTFNLYGAGEPEGAGIESMEDTVSEVMSEEVELRRGVKEGITEDISMAVFGGKVIGEDRDVRVNEKANEEAGPVEGREMNNNVIVKEELPIEQSSDEDSDDVEVEVMEEEENDRDQVKRPEEDEARSCKGPRIEENEAAEGDKCDKWEDGGDSAITETGSKSRVACELCGKEVFERNLRSHMRFKHGCKATKCPRCSRKVYSLKFHNCLIKESDLVGCEVCGQRVTKKFYTAHMKKEHGWGPNKFPKCSRCGHRTNSFTNHKCPYSKSKSTCPDCGAQTFFLAKHLGTNVCKLRAAGNRRGKLKEDRCTAEEPGALVSPAGGACAGAGGPPRTSEPRLESRGSGGKPGGKELVRKRKSDGKLKPAMIAPEPVCEYERIRAANIAEREAMFQALGIQGHVREVKEK